MKIHREIWVATATLMHINDLPTAISPLVEANDREISMCVTAQTRCAVSH